MGVITGCLVMKGTRHEPSASPWAVSLSSGSYSSSRAGLENSARDTFLVIQSDSLAGVKRSDHLGLKDHDEGTLRKENASARLA